MEPTEADPAVMPPRCSMALLDAAGGTLTLVRSGIGNDIKR